MQPAHDDALAVDPDHIDSGRWCNVQEICHDAPHGPAGGTPSRTVQLPNEPSVPFCTSASNSRIVNASSAVMKEKSPDGTNEILPSKSTCWQISLVPTTLISPMISVFDSPAMVEIPVPPDVISPRANMERFSAVSSSRVILIVAPTWVMAVKSLVLTPSRALKCSSFSTFGV